MAKANKITSCFQERAQADTPSENELDGLDYFKSVKTSLKHVAKHDTVRTKIWSGREDQRHNHTRIPVHKVT